MTNCPRCNGKAEIEGLNHRPDGKTYPATAFDCGTLVSGDNIFQSEKCKAIASARLRKLTEDMAASMKEKFKG